MRRTRIVAALAVVLSGAASSAHAAIEFGQNVTNEFFNGTGIANGSFTTDRNAAAGLELGLKAHVRFDTPPPHDPSNDSKNSGLNNIYGSFDAQGYTTPGPVVGGPRASWNFDWSINVAYNAATGASLDDYVYSLQLDYNPGAGVDFGTFDIINSGFVVDHSFGTNATVDPPENDGDETTGSGGTYAGLISDPAFNIAQNSGQLNFFNVALGKAFDPNASGIYDIILTAFSRTSGQPVASSGIQVIVGTPQNEAVPEATALLTWGGLALCGGVLAWRKKARTA